jgi:hypothetical protein
MWFDTVVAILVAVLAWLGFRRGALATFLQIFTLIAAYVLALWLGPRFGPALALSLGVTELIGIAAAGLGIFFASYALLAAAAHFARKRDEHKRYGRATGDRLGGGALGLAQGALVGLLLGVLGSWLQAGREVAKIEAIPDTASARVPELSRQVIETAASALMAEQDAGSRVALRLVTRPTQTLRAVQGLMEREELRALQNDPMFWTYLENNQVDRALNTNGFLQLSYREDVRRQLAELGMADPRGVEDVAFFRQEMRVMLEQLAPRVRVLRRDPMVADLARDPEVVRALREGDTAALLTHSGIQEVAQRVLRPPSDPPQP